MDDVDDPRATINGADIFAQGDVSLSEAIKVITNITGGSVGTLYDGPGALEDARLLSPKEADQTLDTAVRFASDFEYENRLDREERLENIGFDNSNYGSGSVVQELMDGHAPEGAESDLYMLAGTSSDGTEYAVVAELEPAIRSTEEDFTSQLVMEGLMAGDPNGAQDVQEYARTVGGELSEAYQTVANLD